jgi:hypothetical protein
MLTPSPRGYLDEATLFAIELAMSNVWTTVQARDQFSDWPQNGELRTAVAEKLMDLAEAGVTNADDLTRKTLESLAPYRT